MSSPETKAFRAHVNRSGAAFGAIDAIRDDHDAPIGKRLETLRRIEEAARRAHMRLCMQLGSDTARYLIERGVKPTGRPVSEAFKELDNRLRQEETA